MELQKIEAQQTAVAEAEIRSFALSVEEVSKIVAGGKPLSAKDIETREPMEVFSADTLERIRETPEPGIAMPASIGDLIFPPVVSTQRVFCFCIGYVWCLIGGRYILKCRYFCLRLPFAA